MTHLRHRITAALTGTLVAAGLAVGGPAGQADAAQGTKPLVDVLAADGVAFDRNPRDFDIAEAAVLAVLAEKPRSPLSLITKGNQRLTVFLPTDGAFKRLVRDLAGVTPQREKAAFKRVAAATGDIDTLETVLLYHVVAGRTLTSPKVIAAAEAGAAIETAQGGSWTVNADGNGKIRLADADRDDLDPRAIPRLLDVNRGNQQVVHGINRVLRPVDL